MTRQLGGYLSLASQALILLIILLLYRGGGGLCLPEVKYQFVDGRRYQTERNLTGMEFVDGKKFLMPLQEISSSFMRKVNLLWKYLLFI